MADFPLIKASSEGNLEKVRRLLIDGIDVNEVNMVGFTALIFAARKGHFEIASLLVEYGARINYQDQAGWSAIHWASACNYLSIVSLLIEKEAEININETFGNTPLMISASYGYFSIVSLLLHNGADPYLLNNHGKTAFVLARENKNSDCVVILENYEHFHRYRKVWLSFATSLSSFQDNQNKVSKQIQIQSQIQSPSLMRVMDSSDLVRYVTEFM